MYNVDENCRESRLGVKDMYLLHLFDRVSDVDVVRTIIGLKGLSGRFQSGPDQD